eukprot:gene34724-42049_t
MTQNTVINVWISVGPSAPTLNYDFDFSLAAELFEIVETGDSRQLFRWIEEKKVAYSQDSIVKWINWPNPTKLGKTPVSMGAYLGKIEAVAILLDEGADHDIKCAGHLSIVRYLIERESVAPNCADNHLNTPLMLTRSVAIARYFLESPQWSNKTKLRWLQQTNKFGQKALDCASSREDHELLWYLGERELQLRSLLADSECWVEENGM